jgi:hypothetical protein
MTEVQMRVCEQMVYPTKQPTGNMSFSLFVEIETKRNEAKRSKQTKTNKTKFSSSMSDMFVFCFRGHMCHSH